ncbi:MAG: adhesin [Dyella sp.]|uniref:adhesin n=1 Tax=Dyella sp. TaxID=1869338 RepID=UPI003F7E12BD
MNTTIRKTLLALAITTLFGSVTAYAQEGRDDHSHNSGVRFDKKVKLDSDISISGDPRVRGRIDIDSAAIAIVDNAQTNGGNDGSNTNLSNSASAADNVAQGASGNIGVNIGAGDNNQQDNAAALSATDASFAFGMADGEVFVNQQGAFNDTMNAGVTNAAGLGGNAFQNASGNIGVNVTSGNNNQQKNAMAASVATTRFAQATVSSNQASAHNTVSNAGFVQQYTDTVDVSMSGDVSGYSLGYGSGGYVGSSYGSYSGTTSSTLQGTADQIGNVYPDMWTGNSHPGGTQTGHFDLDTQTQGGSDLNGDGGALAFGVNGSSSGSESGTTHAHEGGQLGFVELSANDLYADLSGTVTTTRWVINDATNTASLSGSAFQNASGNIGINVSAGTGNQQANSLAMAVAQPSAGGGGGGGGGE